MGLDLSFSNSFAPSSILLRVTLRALGMRPAANSFGSRTSTILASRRLISCTAAATPTSFPRAISLEMVGRMNAMPLTIAAITHHMFFCMNSTLQFSLLFSLLCRSAFCVFEQRHERIHSVIHPPLDHTQRAFFFLRVGGRGEIPLLPSLRLVAMQAQQHGLAIHHIVGREQSHRARVDRQLVAESVRVHFYCARESKPDVRRKDRGTPNFAQQVVALALDLRSGVHVLVAKRQIVFQNPIVPEQLTEHQPADTE